MSKLSGVVAGLAALCGASMLSTSASAHDHNSWSGLYFGGHAGWAKADFDWAWDIGQNIAPASVNNTQNTWGAGAHVGLQHQWGPWVAGIEVGFTGIADRDLQVAVNPFNPGINKGFESRAKWVATVTPKLGWSMGSWLGYVKGGWAFGQIENKTYFSPGLNGSDFGGLQTASQDRHNGWTVGAGLEWKVISNVSLGLEYDFVRLNGDTRTDVQAPGTVPSRHIVGDVDVHQVMARLNLHLHRPSHQAEAMK